MSKKKQRTEEEAKADAQRKKYLDICPAFGRDEDGDTAIDDSTAECEQCGKQDKAMHDACAAECTEGAPEAPAAATEPTEASETAAPDAETTDDTPDETEAPEAPAEKAAEVAEAPPETEAEEAPETPEADTEVSDAPDAPEEAETATSDAEEPAAPEEPKAKKPSQADLAAEFIMSREPGTEFTLADATAYAVERGAEEKKARLYAGSYSGHGVRFGILKRAKQGLYVRV